MSDVFIGPYGHKYRHGTSNAYVNGKCRCKPCTDNNRTRTKLTQLKKHRGVYVSYFVPAQPSRERIQEIMADTGWGTKYLAGLIGMSKNSLNGLVYGRPPKEIEHGKLPIMAEISRKNEEKIMAFKWDKQMGHSHTLVESLGMRRRVHALMCLGYSMEFLGARMQTNGGNLQLALGREYVHKGTFDSMAALYEELHMTRWKPTNRHERSAYTRMVNKAKAMGYAPPMAWDDIDNDERPVVVPVDVELVDPVKFELMRSGVKVKINKPEILPFTKALVELNYTQIQISELMSASQSAVQKRIMRMAS